MLRLYVPSAVGADGVVRIGGAERRHLHTLRLGAGDRLRLFDDAGAEHEVVLERLTTREAIGRVVATVPAAPETGLEITLAPALLKRERMDWMVEKTTELGVTRIAPIVTRYTVARGDHVERWRRIAIAAAKQCGRMRVPAVEPPRRIEDALGTSWPGLRLVAWEDETTVGLRHVGDRPRAVSVLIGPEGGFHGDEIAAARAAGFTAVTLGRRVLRAETASIVAVALCQDHFAPTRD